MPTGTTELTSWVLNKLGRHRLAGLSLVNIPLSKEQIMENLTKITKMRVQYYNTKFKNFDAFLTPTAFNSALKFKNLEFLAFQTNYLTFANFFDLPAGVVPVTRVKPSEETGYESNHGDFIEKAAIDDLKGSAGLPVCV